MPSEPPPAYDGNSTQNGIYSGFQNLNYENGNPKPAGYQRAILPPTVPPGGIETLNFQMVPPYPSQSYPDQTCCFSSYPYPHPHPPPFCGGLRSGTQTPCGGRYRVTAGGYIEHLTEEQYQNRRVMQGIFTVFIVVTMIIFIGITLKMMASQRHH